MPMLFWRGIAGCETNEMTSCSCREKGSSLSTDVFHYSKVCYLTTLSGMPMFIHFMYCNGTDVKSDCLLVLSKPVIILTTFKNYCSFDLNCLAVSC